MQICSENGNRRARFAAAVIATMAMIAPAVHADFNINLNPSGTLYGNPPVNQSNVPPADGANSCAPTAAANSLAYLTNAFPTLYGNMLLQDKTTAGGPANPQPNTNAGWTTIAGTLASGSYMMTDANNGTTVANQLAGTMNYINNNAPGTTLFESTSNPTGNYLLNDLMRGQDLEIDIFPTAGGIGHVLTVSSATGTQDANGNVTSMSLDGVDPAGGAAFSGLTLGNVGGPGPMTLTYGGLPYTVGFALAQSPIPEPATLTLMVMGVGGAAIVFRRPRRGR